MRLAKIANINSQSRVQSGRSAIAEVPSDMDAEILALETQLRKTRDIKQGIMQQLLTGKVRLV